MTIRDTPRTYTGLAVAWAKRHSTLLYAAGAVFAAAFTSVAVLTIIHIQVTEVGIIAAAEAKAGDSFGRYQLPSLYFNTVLYVAVGVSCLHELLK